MFLLRNKRKGIPIKSPYSREEERKREQARHREEEREREREKKKIRTSSSHEFISPINTLDTNFSFSPRTSQFPTKLNSTNKNLTVNTNTHYKPSTSLTKLLPFPVKVSQLPLHYTPTPMPTSNSSTTFSNLIKKYPSDTFDNEVSRGNQKEALARAIKPFEITSESEEEENEKDSIFDFPDSTSFINKKSPAGTISKNKSKSSTPVNSSNHSIKVTQSPLYYSPSSNESSPQNTTTKTKTNSNITKTVNIPVSTLQYRHIILPPSKSVYNYSDFELVFTSSARIIGLIGKVNESHGSYVIPYAKIRKVQFFRKDLTSSGDWYIDFVLSDLIDLKFLNVNIFNPNDAGYSDFLDCNTLRIYFNYKCSLSITEIENILLSSLQDRKAFNFTDIRDAYGDFEKTFQSSSPNNSSSSSISYNPRTPSIVDRTLSNRSVPSWDSLSTSDSVKLRSAYTLMNSKKSISSPDIFNASSSKKTNVKKRTSSRLSASKSTNTSPSPSTSSKQLSDSYTYVDPDFGSECIKLFSFPEGEMDSVLVTSNELQRLEPGIWLNDTLIDFELKFLYSQFLPGLQENIHIFNSFFYRRLSSASIPTKVMTINSLNNPSDSIPKSPSPSGSTRVEKKTGYDMVKSWTRNVNIFEKDYLVIPINENLHWYLAIICKPSAILNEEMKLSLSDDEENEILNTEPVRDEEEIEKSKSKSIEITECDQEEKDKISLPMFVDLEEPEDENFNINLKNIDEDDKCRILIFDSLGLTSRGRANTVITRLRSYLLHEAYNKLGKLASKSACVGHVVKVPQQENYTDCGCFLLQFVEEFFKSPAIFQSITESSFDMSNWFPAAIAQGRRDLMKQRIEHLAQDFAARQEHKNGTTSPPQVQEDRSSDIEEIDSI